MTEEITLERVCNKLSWGFRLTGGRDFGSPLTVSRIQAGSISEKGGLRVGDIITHIGTEKANQLTHADAQRCVIECGNTLKLTVLRGSCPDVQRALTPIRGIVPDSPFRAEVHRKAVSTISASSVCSLYEDDSFELLDQSEDELTDDYREPTEKEIDEMLLENAEVLEENGKSVIGVNFHRFIPKCEFIKDSAVFAVLQEEQVHKELSEREQLAKCPNKRFSTFLAPPDRPIPTPKRPPEKQKEQDANGVKSENDKSDEACGNQPIVCCKKKTSTGDEKADRVTPTPQTESLLNEVNNNQDEGVHSNDNPEENESVPSAATENETEVSNQVAESNLSNQVCIREVQDDDDDDDDTSSKTNSEKAVEFETQLKNIKNTLNTLGELPSMIQSQLQNIQTQINNLLKLKAENDGKGKSDRNSENRNVKDDQTEPVIEEYDEDETAPEDDNSTDSYTDYEERLNEETEIKEGTPRKETEKHEDEKVEEKKPADQCQEKQIDEDLELRKRRICPLTPLPRPVVLPGGRIWRKPQDAYNEEFIAETLISQAEVLVGSTLGVNFRKYEPPKFDVSNSAVYKLIHNIESKKTGLENRDTVPALQDYYQSPISARHFYLAKLADRVHSPKESENKEERQAS